MNKINKLPKKKIVVKDVYNTNTEDVNIKDIITSSYLIFVQKEAIEKNDEICYNTHDEWSLILGGTR